LRKKEEKNPESVYTSHCTVVAPSCLPLHCLSHSLSLTLSLSLSLSLSLCLFHSRPSKSQSDLMIDMWVIDQVLSAYIVWWKCAHYFDLVTSLCGVLRHYLFVSICTSWRRGVSQPGPSLSRQPRRCATDGDARRGEQGKMYEECMDGRQKGGQIPSPISQRAIPPPPIGLPMENELIFE
jgi:hypothetical protein